jgi:hypothetical protein
MRNLVAAALAVAAFPAAAQSLECARFDVAVGAEPAGYAQQCLGRNTDVPSQLKALTALLGDGTPRGYAAQISPLEDFPDLGLYAFDLPDFSAAAMVDESTVTTNMYGMDFNPAATRLYGVQVLTNVGTRLGVFDLDTGEFETSSFVGVYASDTVTGLAIHPRTGQGWLTSVDVLTNNPQISESRLWQVDLTTGRATLAGRMLPDQLNPVFIDLAINCSGDFYAHNIGDDTLYRVDPQDAEAVAVGPSHGLPANFAQGMSFDRSDDQLYAWIYTGAGANTFGAFDTETGAFEALSQGPTGQWEGAIRATCSTIPITPAALTGAWFAPYTNGQGFTIRHYDDGTIFMPWFTFSQEGGDDADEQRWYWLAGSVEDGAAEVELPIFQTVGGTFDAAPSVGGTQVGTARMSFFSCTEGVLEYQFDEGVNGGAQGSVSMTRLLATGADCTDYDGSTVEAQVEYDAQVTGSWYDPANAGQGLEIFHLEESESENVPLFLYGAWFTFEPAPAAAGPAGQRWFTLQNARMVEDEEEDEEILTVGIYQTRGGSFDDGLADPAVAIGTAELRPDGCDRLVLSYDFQDSAFLGDFRNLEGEIELRRLGDCPAD